MGKVIKGSERSREAGLQNQKQQGLSQHGRWGQSVLRVPSGGVNGKDRVKMNEGDSSGG